MHRIQVFALALLGSLALPLAAHHSFATVFDMNKPATFSGTVTKVEWTNPHAWFYVDVKDEKGVVHNYACETGPPNVLARNGWKKDSLKIGDTVNVSAYRAKDGTDTFSTRQITLPDGRKVFAGSAADEGK